MPRSERSARARALSLLAAAYLSALGAAVLVGAVISSRHPLVVAAVADCVATAVVFAWSFALDNSSIYDPYWSVVPPLLLGYFGWSGREGWGTPGFLLVGAVVLAWAVRLTANCLRRWEGLRHEDFRYVDLRRKHGRLYWGVSLLGIHFFPTVLVFLGSVPLHAVATSPAPPGALCLSGAALAAVATYLEARADGELRRFLTEDRAPGAILREGLWATSRHPNYFGEILFWWGLFVAGLGAGAPLWSGVGALAITLLFAFVSVPMMDARLLARRPGYADHVRRTNALVPWFPRR